MERLPENIINIVTDSRSVLPSDICRGDTAFVALRTAVGDGHRFVRPLYEHGLRTFVVNSAVGFDDLVDAVFVETADTLDFLIRTAAERLSACSARQIVVTGSHRKTTTKEVITAALRRAGLRTARSPRTWNSAMGVALSIIDNVASNPDVIVTEVGIDAPGQASRVAPMLRPEVGVLTRMSDEHDEAFDSHAAKVAEKIALVAGASTIVYDPTDAEVGRQLALLKEKRTDLRLVQARTPAEAAAVVAGVEVADVDTLPGMSTRTETRRAPGDCVIFVDDFTNDIDSLGLTLDLAGRRRPSGYGMHVFLIDFDPENRDKATAKLAERDATAHFVDGAHPAEGLVRDDYAGTLIVVKGGTAEARKRLTTFFDAARHDTMLEVDLDALVHNYNYYRSLLPRNTGIVGMVKASAYGLGALEVAKTLQAHGAAYLAVAVIDEGVALRCAGVTMPIIVLNPITNNFQALVDYRLEPTVFSIDELDRVSIGVASYLAPGAVLPVHIKLDTGMHRLGFLESDIEPLAEALRRTPSVCVRTIFSHLATADCPDLTYYTQLQVDRYERMSSALIAALGDTSIRRHLLNTAGISTLGRTAAAYDMARLGIGLYGVSAVGGDETRRLRPVATLVSTVISLKHWPADTPIGYGCRGVTTRDSVIATVPIGYADGVDRRLGNGAMNVIVRGVECPTIGNICMDLMMVDVTDAVGVSVGDRVEIFGTTARVERLAETLGTIPYEPLVSVSDRVCRTYFRR